MNMSNNSCIRGLVKKKRHLSIAILKYLKCWSFTVFFGLVKRTKTNPNPVNSMTEAS